MQKPKIFFVVTLTFCASLIYFKPDLFNTNESASSKDSTELVEFEREPSEGRPINLVAMTEAARVESDDIARAEAADKHKLASRIDETNQQMVEEFVGNTGDSLRAEIQLWDYLSDYTSGNNSYYIDKFSCQSYVCEVNILFLTQSNNMLKPLSTLMRDLPYQEANVEDISHKDLSARLIIYTEELK